MRTRKASAANEVNLEETDRAFPPGSVVVQKFGDSSLADAAGILRAAERIAKTRTNGYRVVAVVSAMGDTTDDLCDLAAEVSPRPLPVDLDALLSIGELVSAALLAIALTDLGQVPRTFTGSAAGLVTDSIHGRAHIIDVRPNRVRSSLANGEVPIVAGFQGRTQKRNRVTTLGRGGSVSRLSRWLQRLERKSAKSTRTLTVSIPRIPGLFRQLENSVLSSEEMLELAASGSKVLHLRCVEYARRFGLPIHVRSSFVPVSGTLILPGLDRHPLQQPAKEQAEVTAVSGVDSTSKITVAGIPDKPDSIARIFQVLSRSGADVQAIVQNTAGPGTRRSDVSLVVPVAQAAAALAVLGAEKGSIGFEGLHNDGEVGRVSISGLGMRSSPEIFCTFLKALSDADVDLDLFDISETSMGAVTHADRLADAERAVRRAFGMAPSDEGTVAGQAGDLTTVVRQP